MITKNLSREEAWFFLCWLWWVQSWEKKCQKKRASRVWRCRWDKNGCFSQSHLTENFNGMWLDWWSSTCPQKSPCNKCSICHSKDSEGYNFFFKPRKMSHLDKIREYCHNCWDNWGKLSRRQYEGSNPPFWFKISCQIDHLVYPTMSHQIAHNHADYSRLGEDGAIYRVI